MSTCEGFDDSLSTDDDTVTRNISRTEPSTGSLQKPRKVSPQPQKSFVGTGVSFPDTSTRNVPDSIPRCRNDYTITRNGDNECFFYMSRGKGPKVPGRNKSRSDICEFSSIVPAPSYVYMNIAGYAPIQVTNEFQYVPKTSESHSNEEGGFRTATSHLIRAPPNTDVINVDQSLSTDLFLMAGATKTGDSREKRVYWCRK